MTELVLKVRSFNAILVAFDRENVGWKMVYNFLGIDEKKKNTQKCLLTFA